MTDLKKDNMSKTFSVDVLKKMVNNSNRTGTQSALERQGHNSLLESILHQTGNYRGFGYLHVEDVPAGEKPGVAFDNGTIFPDETRRHYY